MGEVLEHKCGLVLAYTLHDVYAMIKDLQHRGKEAAGIAAVGDSSIDVLKWVGKVDRFDREDLHKIFPGNDYYIFFAHVRYATHGRKEHQQILLDAHPHTLGGNRIDYGDHVLVLDCDAAMVHNGQVDLSSLEGVVRGELKTGCDTEALLHYYNLVGERQLLQTVAGAYTLVLADRKKKEVMVMRDRTGIRIGALGTKGGKYCVVSEDIAIRKNGGSSQGELEPGAIYYFDSNGKYRKEQVIDRKETEQSLAHCMFEYLYLANSESVVNGASVYHVRDRLGKQMAKEFRGDFDFVTYIPRAPEAAARRYAEETGIPFLDVFYKPNSDRSFMSSTQAERAASIKSNFFLVPSVIPQIRGKKVLAVDDSIIRGTVIKRVKELLFETAGVSSATFLSYTPPIGIIGDDGVARGCSYGVDMSPDDDFIVRVDEAGTLRNATPEEINAKAGMLVRYLSPEGLNAVFDEIGMRHTKLCMYCIGGKKPFAEKLVQLRKKE